MIRFNKEKHGYKIVEVDSFISEQNRTISQLKEQITMLKKELEQKDEEIKSFNQKQDLIAKSIISAVEKAEQIEHLINQKYISELDYLKSFHQQWTEYYKSLIKKYPLSEELNALAEFNRRLDEILCGDERPADILINAKDQFEKESKRLKKKYIGYIPVSEDYIGQIDDDFKDFNPEETIRQLLRRQISEEKNKKESDGPSDFIAASSDQCYDSGFSFEEALNPKQNLSEILKDIGILQEDEETQN